MTVTDTWRDDAACKGQTARMYLDVFQPLARATCQTCPVRVECQQEGLSEDWGTWGGLGPTERRRVRNKKRRPLRIDL